MEVQSEAQEDTTRHEEDETEQGGIDEKDDRTGQSVQHVTEKAIQSEHGTE